MSQTPLSVTTDWVAEHRNDPNVVVVDATTILEQPDGDGYYDLDSGRNTYLAGHIPGAVFADLLVDFADQSASTTFTALPSAEFAEKIGALGIGNDTHVVIYDQGNNMWATRLWWNLRLEGHDTISVVDGGFAAWQGAGLPVETDVPTLEPKTFVANRRPELLLSKDDVLATIDNDDTVFINVLDAETYSGERKTYERRGHIPGSINFFFGNVLNEDQTLADPETVKERLSGTDILSTDKKVATYCGSGIAATLEAFQFARLGLNDVAIYDGSMTEWSADPELPLVEGTAVR